MPEALEGREASARGRRPARAGGRDPIPSCRARRPDKAAGRIRDHAATRNPTRPRVRFPYPGD